MSQDIEIRELNKNEYKVWDTIVDNSPQGTIFSKTIFSEALNQVTGKGYTIYGIFKNTNLIGGCPVYSKKRFGFKMAILPSLVPYSGIVLKTPSSKYSSQNESLRLKIENLICQKLSTEYDYVYLAHHPTLQDIRGFVWNGWRIHIRYTHVIDLKDYSLEKIDPFTRRRIKKATEYGVKISESNDIERVVNLVEKSYLRHSATPPFPKHYLVGLFERGIYHLFIAQNPNGDILSGMIVVKDPPVAYGGILGSEPEALKTGVNSLLLWSVLSSLTTEFEQFDFMGANVQSIAKFKSNFGGNLIPYYVCEKYKLHFITLLRGYRFIKNLRNVIRHP